MTDSLNGQIALVTGAARGIGRAVAAELGRLGARVWVADLNAAALDATVAALADAGISATAIALDVSDRSAAFAAVDAIVEGAGRLDVLVNAAGLYTSAAFLDTRIEDFGRLLDVNLFGTVNLMQAALPGMRARGVGRIINIASTAGKMGSLNQSAYNVSKHAVVGLTRCVAMEFAKTGVTVNAICPGPVRTEMLNGLWESQAKVRGVPVDAVKAEMIGRVPLGRFIEPDEIASMAGYLASPAAAAVTAQSFAVDGGSVQV